MNSINFKSVLANVSRLRMLLRFGTVLLVALTSHQVSAAIGGGIKSAPLNLPTGSGSSAVVNEQFQAAMELYNQGEHAEAVRRWNDLAANGDIEAQFVLGALHTVGDRSGGVERDMRTATAWYEKAAERGHPIAQFNLGVFYANGTGVAQDMTFAARWWQRAALQGHVEAQFNLGLLYAQGLGIAADPKEAVRWWDLAAKQGSAAAQFNLGVMYVKGEGVEEDPSEAVRLWQLSARQGFGQAINILKTLNLTE